MVKSRPEEARTLRTRGRRQDRGGQTPYHPFRAYPEITRDCNPHFPGVRDFLFGFSGEKPDKWRGRKNWQAHNAPGRGSHGGVYVYPGHHPGLVFSWTISRHFQLCTDYKLYYYGMHRERGRGIRKRNGD